MPPIVASIIFSLSLYNPYTTLILPHITNSSFHFLFHYPLIALSSGRMPPGDLRVNLVLVPRHRLKERIRTATTPLGLGEASPKTAPQARHPCATTFPHTSSARHSEVAAYLKYYPFSYLVNYSGHNPT